MSKASKAMKPIDLTYHTFFVGASEGITALVESSKGLCAISGSRQIRLLEVFCVDFVPKHLN